MNVENPSRRQVLQRIGLAAGGMMIGPSNVSESFQRPAEQPHPTPVPEVMDLGADHAKQLVRDGMTAMANFLITDTPRHFPGEGDYLVADYTVEHFDNGQLAYTMNLPTQNKKVVEISLIGQENYNRLDKESVEVISVSLKDEEKTESSYVFTQDRGFSVSGPEGIFSTEPSIDNATVVNPLSEQAVSDALEGANKLINLVLPH